MQMTAFRLNWKSILSPQAQLLYQPAPQITLGPHWEFPTAGHVLSASGHWADPLLQSAASALLRGGSAAFSIILAPMIIAEITCNDGYHIT